VLEMDLEEENAFLHGVILNVTGKSLCKITRNLGIITSIVTRLDEDSLFGHHLEGNTNRLKVCVRYRNLISLTAKWRGVYVDHSEWKEWKAYLAGESQGVNRPSMIVKYLLIRGEGIKRTLLT
jgi:hypothetical protein